MFYQHLDTLSIHKLAKEQYRKDSIGISNKVKEAYAKITYRYPSVGMPYKKIPGKPHTVTSLFKGHLLQAGNIKESSAAGHTPSWIFISLLFAISIYALIRQYSNRKLTLYINSFFTSRFTGQLMREESGIFNRITIGLLVAFVLISGIFVIQVMDYNNSMVKDSGLITKYALVCAAIVAVYSIKFIFIKLFGFIFKMNVLINDYIYYVILINIVIGMALLPVVIGYEFFDRISNKIWVYSGFAIMAILLIFRIVRGVELGIGKVKISMLYIFLYLCTLEILPILLIVKLFRIGVLAW